ncbi:MAG: hypothetical protein K0R18_37 [Bacillales bacterium]|jgi:phosphopantothenate-cysteine ligase|nr:hypothetical protein [Bacillales bacterium]
MNILITAGGTKEAIDKVRHITNMSSGSLGREIAAYATTKESIKEIHFVGPKEAFPKVKFGDMQAVDKYVGYVVDSVEDLSSTLEKILTTKKIDVVIHSMAVSDYTVDYVCNLEDMVNGIFEYMSVDTECCPADVIDYIKKGEFRIDTNSKMSSKSEDPIIKLTPTQKVIGNIKKWAPDTVLVGFKLLENVSDDELIKVARQQMHKNKCDFVWANDIKRIRETGHQGLLIENDGVTCFHGKESIAKGIIDAVIHYVKE